jgi:ABC-type nitrate/sulfonate/bicarbonate transport system substrate-binding protein
MAKEEFIERHGETVYRLTKATIEANRWIAGNKAGTLEVLRKLRKEESPEVLGRAYDLTDPRLWGVNGDLAEGANHFTADFLVKVGSMASPLPYERFFDRRLVDRALAEMARR